MASYYKVNGRMTGYIAFMTRNLGYKNIDRVETTFGNNPRCVIYMKDGTSYDVILDKNE